MSSTAQEQTKTAVVEGKQTEEAKTAEAKVIKNFKVVGYWQLFKYCSSWEKTLIWVSIFTAIAQGAMMPISTLMFGEMSNSFNTSNSESSRTDGTASVALKLFLVSLGSLVSTFLSSWMWGYVGNRLTMRVKKLYFTALMGQEMGWFDVENPMKMTTSYIENMHKFDGAVGTKNQMMISSISMSISGFIIGYYKGWWFALIVTMSFPIVMVGFIFFLMIIQKQSVVTKQNYENAGSLAEQCLTSIRTVKSLRGEKFEVDWYTKFVEAAREAGTRFGFISALTFGFFNFTIFVSYGLNYWIGSLLVEKPVYNHNMGINYNVGDVVTIFFSVITGAMSIGGTSPSSQAIAMGREAAYTIYQVIERESKIPLNDPNGHIPQDIEGDIEFRDVGFSYPSRPETKVLNGLNLKIPKGKKVALVGETGCGKSTTIQLVERYYDPSEGQVLIDGRDIKDYNLRSLRRHIGYVSQEPVLFAMTIKENLLIAKPEATDAELEAALKKANAYNFVMKLEHKLETYVGAGGSQLSGGQKQRVSIARSILQNPKILLLDEATSALDRRNEREIQATLDAFTKQRTTLTVAHRLSTVLNSDIVFVIKGGQVVEQGTHDELIRKKGAYAKLVEIQLGGIAVDELTLMAHKSVEEPQALAMERARSDELPQAGAPAEEEEEVKKSEELTLEEKRALRLKDEEAIKRASKRLGTYLQGNYFIISTACFFSVGAGCLMPLFALFLADMITVLAKYDYLRSVGINKGHPEWEKNKEQALLVGLYFIVIAVASLITYFFQLGLFTKIAQQITTRLRRDLYQQFITRDQEFFDDPKNNPGELSSVLAKDCLTVNTIVSTSYGAKLNGIGSLVCGLIIAFISSWRLSLVALSVSPLLILSGVIKSKYYHEKFKNEEKNDTKEAKTFQESCTNMKTISSLNAQAEIKKKFEAAIDKEVFQSNGRLVGEASLLGMGGFAIFGIYALCFYAGSQFVRDYGLGYNEFFRALFAILFGASGAGQSQQQSADIPEAEKAAKKIFEYLDVQNKVQPPASPVTSPIKGHIEFRNVKFTYPQRKTPCFTDLSFTIAPQQKVAFAGPSGSGKSTIFALLYRFYDVDSGEILVDGVNIKNYDIAHLRAALGMVSQEPVLFDESISYNIKYNREYAQPEVDEATDIANAAKFIRSDSEGFTRKVGLKGSKLSGGQKQRVAIARTVIRRPSVYMFDESTSALDTESEKIVQDAINKISTGNTSLTIAHRISTIKDADLIFVIDKGRVVEKGSFAELLSARGLFYSLNTDV